MQNKFYPKKRKGFSMVETIVAIGIITITLLGVSSLAVQNLQVQNVNKNYLTASALAQEGIELVRNMRDQNWLIEGTWDQYLVGDGTYTIDYDFYIKYSVDDIADARLYINGDSFYDHNEGGTPTNYYRLISAVKVDDNHIQASSTVWWTGGRGANTYVVSTDLYSWR